MPTCRTLILLALAGLVAATSLMLFEPRWALVSCLLGWTMLAVAVSDVERFIVPDILSLPAIPAGLIVTRLLADGQAAPVALLQNFAAAVVGAGAMFAIKELYYAWREREGLGLGDVKLAAVAGAWTGPEGIIQVLLVACVLAIAYVALAHWRDVRSIRATAAVPFGTFLGPSIWFVWCADTLAARYDLSATIGAL